MAEETVIEAAIDFLLAWTIRLLGVLAACLLVLLASPFMAADWLKRNLR